MAGLTHKTEYKPLRTKEIKKSEILVTKVIDVLENEYWSPFSVFLQDEEVYNLSSGKKFEGNVEKLLDIKKQGQQLMDTFMGDRIQSNKTPFHEPLTKQKPTLFKQQQIKKKNKDHAKEVIKVNRDILGNFCPSQRNCRAQSISKPFYPIHYVQFHLVWHFQTEQNEATRKAS
eukprot:TCONS_00065281-protein